MLVRGLKWLGKDGEGCGRMVGSKRAMSGGLEGVNVLRRLVLH